MTVELKKGYIIDSYYDKNTRSYITTLKDNEGNQIRDAYYSNNMTDRNSDIQHIKEFFYKYMDSKTGAIEDEDTIDDEVVEESLKSKIIETKKKTKKSKLPALSTLSPIMPDGAAGIATFNSGVGLSEEYLNREELINRISKMGFKYKFDKYSDAALYRIYQERLRELERRKKAKREKKQRADELENKRVNSQDSYFENGIEFESEDAAREYFGESMNNFEDTARVRDITAWAFSKGLDLDTTIKVVERQMKKEGSIIPNNLRSIVYDCWDDLSDNYDNEYFGESMDNKIYLNDIHKAWGLNEGWMSNELYDQWGDDPESLRIEEVEPGYFTVFSHDGNSTYYFGNSKEDCIDWCEDNNEKYFIYESKKSNDKNILNESLNNKRNNVKHNFRTITEGLKYFERKEFSENCRDAELELLYEGIKNNLDQEDIKKLGNFLKKADSADDVATFIKGLLSEDMDYDTSGTYDSDGDAYNTHYMPPEDEWDAYFTSDYYEDGDDYLSEDIHRYSDVVPYEDRKYWYFTTHGVGTGTIPKDLHVLEVREGQNDRGTWGDFICLDGVLNTSELQKYDLRELPPTTNESLTEARKPKFVDTMFGRHVKDAMDRGELTYDNIEEWDRNYNGGKDPIPAFNTRELMNFYYMRPDYFDESLNEDMDSAKDNLFYKAYDARPELMENILAEFGCTPDTCETLEDIPTDIKRKAFSTWLKEVRELAKWHDEMDSQVYDIIDLVDSSSLGESLKESLKKTLNESYYVREWWGQVDENPYDVADMYNLDIRKIRNKHDSTLYEFSGDLENLNKAKDDGYFYDSDIIEVKGDIAILQELVKSLEKVGFILDESTLNGGLTNTRGQNWHLQVINPNMVYPNSETEGEDISEEVADRLFMDDLKEVVQVLDEIEHKYPYISITFNFGANKDNIITGGIDMRMMYDGK